MSIVTKMQSLSISHSFTFCLSFYFLSLFFLVLSYCIIYKMLYCIALLFLSLCHCEGSYHHHHHYQRQQCVVFSFSVVITFCLSLCTYLIVCSLTYLLTYLLVYFLHSDSLTLSDTACTTRTHSHCLMSCHCP